MAEKDPEITFTEDGGVRYGQQGQEDELAWEDEEPAADEAAAESKDKAAVTEAKPSQETEAKPSHETVDPSIPPSDVKSQQEAPRA